MELDMLARLLAQAEGDGADRTTLRAIAEQASEAGAARALGAIGLGDTGAGTDIRALRELLGAWRDAKRSAASAFVAWVVRVLLALLLLGIAAKTDLLGLARA